METALQITIAKAEENQRQQIIDLLIAEHLPVDDLPASLAHFFVAENEGVVIGAIGLEDYNRRGLLRSMVVKRNFRNNQVAGRLVQQLEMYAQQTGIHSLYLLTETAQQYFERKGFQYVGREEVPEAIRMSSEFSHVCPVSAAVMKKELN